MAYPETLVKWRGFNGIEFATAMVLDSGQIFRSTDLRHRPNVRAAEILSLIEQRFIDEFREEVHRNRIRGVVERLPGTTHGFAMADLPVYNPDAAEHHFERTLDLWRRNLSQSQVKRGPD